MTPQKTDNMSTCHSSTGKKMTLVSKTSTEAI